MDTKEEELRSETRIEQAATGERFRIMQIRRGFLHETEIRKIQTARHNGPYRPNGKRALEELASTARDNLDRLGLPTDKWPRTPIELDYGYVAEEHGISEEDDLWWDVTAEDTEPLSQDRISADLLHAIVSFAPQCTEKLLSDIWRFAQVYHRHETARTLHRAALQGQGSKRGRVHGPIKRRDTKQISKAIIWSEAEACWAMYPKLNGEPWNTSKKIADRVNEKRRAALPKSKPLSTKRISDLLAGLLAEHVSKTY